MSNWFLLLLLNKMGVDVSNFGQINSFVTPELSFHFNYFFNQKFWMVFHCKALVACPGGIEVLDQVAPTLILF